MRLNMAISQVEFFLGSTYLPNNKFLLSQADHGGWIDINVIQQFPRMRIFNATNKDLVTLLRHSKTVEVNHSGTHVRPRPPHNVYSSVYLNTRYFFVNGYSLPYTFNPQDCTWYPTFGPFFPVIPTGHGSFGVACAPLAAYAPAPVAPVAPVGPGNPNPPVAPGARFYPQEQTAHNAAVAPEMKQNGTEEEPEVPVKGNTPSSDTSAVSEHEDSCHNSSNAPELASELISLAQNKRNESQKGEKEQCEVSSVAKADKESVSGEASTSRKIKDDGKKKTFSTSECAKTDVSPENIRSHSTVPLFTPEDFPCLVSPRLSVRSEKAPNKPSKFARKNRSGSQPSSTRLSQKKSLCKNLFDIERDFPPLPGAAPLPSRIEAEKRRLIVERQAALYPFPELSSEGSSEGMDGTYQLEDEDTSPRSVAPGAGYWVWRNSN